MSGRSSYLNKSECAILWNRLLGFIPTSVEFMPGEHLDFDVFPPANFSNLLDHRGRLVDRKRRIFMWKFGEKTVYSDNSRIFYLHSEYLSGKFHEYYNFDVRGKTILDIGGFVGDTARYFLENGAKKVFVYDPIAQNLACAKLNLRGFPRRYKLFRAAVCSVDGVFTISSEVPLYSSSFGSSKNRGYSVNCPSVSFSKIIDKHHNVDAIKVDCETCEYFLERVSPKLLRRIPHWLIEFHSVAENASRLMKISSNFRKAGFRERLICKLDDKTEIRDFALCDPALSSRGCGSESTSTAPATSTMRDGHRNRPS
jgi:FkbM family methyltransferase